MNILIVDDSSVVRSAIKNSLTEAGYANLLFADSAQSALGILGINIPKEQQAKIVNVDLILLDIVLPDMDGRVVCRLIKGVERFKDVPIIMVTSLSDTLDLEQAFNAGAMDYVTKPVNNVELLVRIRSALKLKYEMDRSKERERNLLAVTEQLKGAVAELNKLSSLDGLTGIPNRRFFDEIIQREWNRCQRNKKPLSILFMDIDLFKAYNDTYGHQAGDDCLKMVAEILQGFMRRGGDMLFRYGGEEFVAIFSETTHQDALLLADNICKGVEAACIPHSQSKVSPYVTISLGVATAIPTADLFYDCLISDADKALYAAKNEGRNRIKAATQ